MAKNTKRLSAYARIGRGPLSPIACDTILIDLNNGAALVVDLRASTNQPGWVTISSRPYRSAAGILNPRGDVIRVSPASCDILRVSVDSELHKETPTNVKKSKKKSTP